MTTETTRLIVDPEWDGGCLEGLSPQATVRAEAPISLRITCLDSFDWRLDDAGVRLWHERRHRHAQLLCQSGQAPSVAVPLRRIPRTAAELPAGHVRELVAPLLEPRALLPMGELAVTRQRWQLRDREGNVSLRVVVERGAALDETGAPVDQGFAVLELSPVPGHETVAAAVRCRLDATVVRRDEADLLGIAAAARGRRPGDYSSKPRLDMAADEAAAEAARRVLSGLLDTIERNVPGVIADLDVEFLHDLRVAVRSSRAVLGQLESVLDPAAVAPHADRLRWLGGVTGALRDLDVYLLEMTHYRELLPPVQAAALELVDRRLRRARAGELRRVRRALRGRRFAELVTGWRQALADPERLAAGATDAATPVGTVAARRILKAHRRVLKRGRRLGDDPAPELLHRLRIDAKKLRYLLELFAALFRDDELQEWVKELKRLQDVLGGFNDMVVQQRRLDELAQELVAAGEGNADTLLAMGRLQAVLGERQEAFRRAFAARFADLDRPAATAAMREMCAAVGGRP